MELKFDKLEFQLKIEFGKLKFQQYGLQRASNATI